jgi:large subunit ribosomal protein L21e
MPHKFYQGRTGVVFNVTKRAIGVTVNKMVNTRIVKKQIHIAVPHIKPSTCQAQIISRKVTNEAHKAAVRAGKAERINLKRQHAAPKTGFFFNNSEEPTTIQPTPYVDLV